jgi:hypothetical protein
MDTMLQANRTKIFLVEGTMEVVPFCNVHRASMIVHELLECYNVSKEEKDEEDPENVQLLETEGERAVKGPYLESSTYTRPIKTHKINIGMT